MFDFNWSNTYVRGGVMRLVTASGKDLKSLGALLPCSGA